MLSLSAQQQSILNEQLLAMRSKPALTDGDLALLRRIIFDTRIDDAQLGVNLQLLFGKFTAQLTSFVPVVLERMKIPVAGSVGQYQGSLGWSLSHFRAEALEPYRTEIVAILEAQAEWPTTGLLTRVAEIGGDPTDLIARRLDSNSSSVREYAAVAACRSLEQTWPALEPIVRSHIGTFRRELGIQGVDSKLMLALVRFGKRASVEQIIEQSDLFNKERIQKQLATYERGFAPDRCRGFL
jgi:hypothetical protein